jgi:hypothetical protein
LAALTAPATGDLLPIVDISEAAAADKNKKITFGELLSSAPDGSAAAPSFSFDGDPNTGIYSAGADQLAISTGGSEKARLDSSGRLLVGTSTARNISTHNAKIQLEGIDYNNSILQVIGNANSTNGAYVFIGKSRGTVVGDNTIVQSGDVLGDVRFYGADGTNMLCAASILGQVDGTPGTNDMPGRLVFSTTADGAASTTERMRIDSTGLVTLAGPGIKFPATQVASSDPNTLDDYEEGTWTPTVVGSSTAGTATYSVQSGTYTKIGRLVTVTYAVSYSSGTGTGNLRIASVPFAVSGAYFYGTADLYNIVMSANSFPTVVFGNSASVLDMYQTAVGGGTLTTIAYDAAGTIYGSITYTV